MKINNVEKLHEVIASEEIKSVLLYCGEGSGFYKIDRMTKNYGNLPLHCKMYKGFESAEDGIYWLMQSDTMIQSSYSQEDVFERKMFEDAKTIVNSATYVIVDMTNGVGNIEAVKVRAKVYGDYSVACVFEEID